MLDLYAECEYYRAVVEEQAKTIAEFQRLLDERNKLIDQYEKLSRRAVDELNFILKGVKLCAKP